MRAIGQPDRGRGAADFLYRDDMIEIAQPQPAPLLLDGDPVQAQRAHRGPEFAREPVLGIGAGGQRGDLFVGEARGSLADHRRAFGQAEIEIGGGAHGFPPCRHA